MAGQIVAGALSPHPPHLVYADNPPQNEPNAECGWEVLRWGYERLRKKWDALDYDVIIVHSPSLENPLWSSLFRGGLVQEQKCGSVFPHLFRYHYDLKVDVELSEQIAAAASDRGLVTKMMRNPHFRVDYGTLVSCHLLRPQWDKPIVAISSNRAYYDFSMKGDAQMLALGQATKEAVLASGTCHSDCFKLPVSPPFH